MLEKSKKRIAFIGAGGVASTALRVIRGTYSDEIEVGGVLVRAPLSDRLRTFENIDTVCTLDDLMKADPSLILECAGHAALREYGAEILSRGVDLLAVSSGALADEDLFSKLMSAANRGGSQLRIAAGAIGGLDWLSACRQSGIESVRYKIRKPPQAWKGSGVDFSSTGASCFYTAPVREAAKAFPKNVNAAATIALATLGFDDTVLELIADPEVSANIHEVEATGEAGSFSLRVRNTPDANNPKTSQITGLSVAHSILRECDTLVI